MNSRLKQPTYLPSPAEIERKCESIQRSWSERERLRRLLFVVGDMKRYAMDEFEPRFSAELAGITSEKLIASGHSEANS